MEYNVSYTKKSALASNSADIVLAAAENVNGAIVFNMHISDITGNCAFLASPDAPTSIDDGDVLFYAQSAQSALEANYSTSAITVPAGKGIYFIRDSAGSPFRSALIKTL
jgi:hypothetical protein